MRILSARRGWVAPMFACVVSVLAVVLVVLLLLGRNSGMAQADQAPREQPGISGTTTRIDKSPLTGMAPGGGGDPDTPVSSDDSTSAVGREDSYGRMLVEENPGREWEGNKATVTVAKGTRILLQQDGKLVRSSWERLRVGSRVQVWFDGPVAESYPVQGTAATILIIER